MKNFPPTRTALFVAVIVVNACGAFAQDTKSPAPGAGGAQREIVVEKTVYVPFDKLEAVFEKEGRGIFLPYEEFLKLWQAGQPKPPEIRPDDPPAPAVLRGGVYKGVVVGDAVRFEAVLEIESLKHGWTELALPFKGIAVESAELSSPRAVLVAKSAAAGAAEYAVFLPEPGRVQARLTFSARVAQEPGKRTVAFSIPPTAVSRLELTVPEENARLEVLPATAVHQTKAVEKTTQVIAYFGNSSDVAVSWLPPVGKIADGGAVVFAEQFVRAYLGERIVKVATGVIYQVLRGETDTLRVRAPDGMRLIAVKGDNIREWKEEEGAVVVRLHSALKSVSYALQVSFERILTETPTTLSLPLPRVEDVLREAGWVVLGHETGLNVRVARAQGLSQADRDEVPEALRDGLGVGFRYLAPPISLDVEIEKITPQVRSLATSVVTLGREEDVWVGWIDYTITKAGLFRLVLRVPDRWSVATVGDATTVEDFQTADSDGQRLITVSLKSKALGTFRLPFRLTAPGTAGAAGDSAHGPPHVVDSSEDRGLFGISCPKAFEITTVSRERTTSADVDELFRSGILPQLAAGSGLPLAFSYREQPASARIRLEAKKTEVELLAQHLVEISDGRVKLTHVLDFEILYAAQDRLLFTAPATLDTLLKVEAKEKKEVRKVSTDQGRTLWEVLLQAPIVGAVTVTVTHEADLKALEPGKRFSYETPILHGRDSREKGFVAVRKEGTLEITPEATGLEAIEASDLTDKLRRGQVYGAFRYFVADPRLTLALTRYEYQPLATAVVNLLKLEGVLSEERQLRTRATLIVQNAERQYLELSLAPERILSLTVAGKPQQPRKRQGAAGTLVQIPTGVGAAGAFPIVIVYTEEAGQGAMTGYGSARMAAPQILDSVPVSKTELDLYVPPGFVYFGWSGSLKERVVEGATLWTQVLSQLSGAVGTAQTRGQEQAFVAQGTPAPTGAGIDVELPTRGLLLYRFDSLAPQATLDFSYAGRTPFRVAQLCLFLAALIGGLFAWRRLKSPLTAIGIGLVFAPLALTWFTAEPVAGLFLSILAAGIVVFGIALVTGISRQAKTWRRSRLALTPDPFLEEAAPAPSPAPDAGKEAN